MTLKQAESEDRGAGAAEPGPVRRRRVRPVDVLPVLFLLTVSGVAFTVPYPIVWDATTVGVWAILTAIAGLLIAAPALIRFDRSFLAPTYKNLPGHALLILLGVSVAFMAPDLIRHPAALVILGLLVAMVKILGRKKSELFTFKRLASAWLPALISFFIYENLRHFIGSLNPRELDAALAALDLKIFGVHHTLLSEQIQTPWLTEWMSLNYGLYLFYPILTGMIFYYEERRAAFEDFTLAFCLTMYAGFICYLLVPAAGPIKGLMHLYTTSTVPGLPYSEYQAAVLEKYRYIRDAFPSLHVAGSLVCLLSLWRPYPRIAKVMLFFEVNLILSTIYLRMHYTVDVVAGAALAFGVVWLAPRLNRRFGVPPERGPRGDGAPPPPSPAPE